MKHFAPLLIILTSINSYAGTNTLFHNYHRISIPERIEITSYSNEVTFMDSGLLVLSSGAEVVRGDAFNEEDTDRLINGHSVTPHGNSWGAGMLFEYNGSTTGYDPSSESINVGLRLLYTKCHSMFAMWRLKDHSGLDEGVYIQVRKSDGVDTQGECINPTYHNIHTTGTTIPVSYSALDGKVHSLSADVFGGPGDYHLRVRADGDVVFDQAIDSSLLTQVNGTPLEGPAGFRTDNGIFNLSVFDRYHSIRPKP